jgi:hypothetical protein
MIAWGGWGRWSNNIHRRNEYNRVVDGVDDPAERCSIRRNLLEEWMRRGYTREYEENRLRRRQRTNNNLKSRSQRRRHCIDTVSDNGNH